jgi:hypothetical protein
MKKCLRKKRSALSSYSLAGAATLPHLRRNQQKVAAASAPWRDFQRNQRGLGNCMRALSYLAFPKAFKKINSSSHTVRAEKGVSPLRLSHYALGVAIPRRPSNAIILAEPDSAQNMSFSRSRLWQST